MQGFFVDCEKSGFSKSSDFSDSFAEDKVAISHLKQTLMFWKQTIRQENRWTLIGFTAIVVIMGFIAWITAPLQPTYWFNGLHSVTLDLFFASITHLGNGLVLVLLSLLLLFYRMYLAAGLIVNGIAQGVVVYFFKHVLYADALRPIAFLDKSAVHAVAGVTIYHLHAFPSGHTVTAFGLAVFLSLWLRNKWASAILLALAVLVGISRVYLLLHFFVDVAAGAAIGTLIGSIAYFGFAFTKHTQWGRQFISIQVQKVVQQKHPVGENQPPRLH